MNWGIHENTWHPFLSQLDIASFTFEFQYVFWKPECNRPDIYAIVLHSYSFNYTFQDYCNVLITNTKYLILVVYFALYEELKQFHNAYCLDRWEPFLRLTCEPQSLCLCNYNPRVRSERQVNTFYSTQTRFSSSFKLFRQNPTRTGHTRPAVRHSTVGWEALAAVRGKRPRLTWQQCSQGASHRCNTV